MSFILILFRSYTDGYLKQILVLKFLKVLTQFGTNNPGPKMMQKNDLQNHKYEFCY